MSTMLLISLCCTGLVSIMFAVNSCLFRRLQPVPDQTTLPAVSILIPARNEAERISFTLNSLLKTNLVNYEIHILDDQSTDGTQGIIQVYMQQHPQIFLHSGTPLPMGWSGKQHACFQLAQLTSAPYLLFLDADVELEPDAIPRALYALESRQLHLLSGFPRQITLTWGEKLLIPLIHHILLGYLPFPLMIWTKQVAAAAGCGQFFLTDRHSYEQMGGHASIQASLHDGIMLPRAYRQAKLTTGVFDGSNLLKCRMYHNFTEVWSGLNKNATEGMARMPQLLIFSTLMIMGDILPCIVLIATCFQSLFSEPNYQLLMLSALALLLSLVPRILQVNFYRSSIWSVLLHPCSIATFLVLQWQAYLKLGGQGTKNWRGRTYPSTREVM